MERISNNNKFKQTLLFDENRKERESREDGRDKGEEIFEGGKKGGWKKNRPTTVEWPRSKFFVMSKVQRLRLNRT